MLETFCRLRFVTANFDTLNTFWLAVDQTVERLAVMLYKTRCLSTISVYTNSTELESGAKGILKPNVQNITTCILSKLLNRFQFCMVTKTTKYFSWVVQKAHHFEKIEKSSYLCNGLTVRYEIWQSDVH